MWKNILIAPKNIKIKQVSSSTVLSSVIWHFTEKSLEIEPCRAKVRAWAWQCFSGLKLCKFSAATFWLMQFKQLLQFQRLILLPVKVGSSVMAGSSFTDHQASEFIVSKTYFTNPRHSPKSISMNYFQILITEACHYRLQLQV